MTPAPATLTKAEARTLTDSIRAAVETVWELVVRAYTERAWDALGYASWDDYCGAEFDTRIRLPREERREVVGSLRESGLSIRAIASATGMGRGTVERELQAVVPNGTPEAPGGVTASTPGQTDRVAAALANARTTPEPWIPTTTTTTLTTSEHSAPWVNAAIDDHAARQAEKIVGTDGKQYPAQKPPKPKLSTPPTEPDDADGGLEAWLTLCARSAQYTLEPMLDAAENIVRTVRAEGVWEGVDWCVEVAPIPSTEINPAIAALLATDLRGYITVMTRAVKHLDKIAAEDDQ